MPVVKQLKHEAARLNKMTEVKSIWKDRPAKCKCDVGT